MGRRVGTKRADRRWEGKDGVIWASRFEEEIYEYLQGAIGSAGTVRKCGKGDSLSYTQERARITCLDCGSSRCAQSRTYTPDLFVDTGTRSYWLEIKGRFTAEKRSLFRSFRKSRPDIVVRFVAQGDFKIGKGRLSGYFKKFLKDVPFIVWNEKAGFPEEWIT